MATWTYSGYESESTDAARLTMARQFKKELLDAMKDPQSTGSDGHSMSKFQYDTLLSEVNRDIERYERMVGAGSPLVIPIRKMRPR